MSIKRHFTPLFVVFISAIIGFSWGAIIQFYRATLRTPGHWPFYFIELILLTSIGIFAYLNRNLLLGKQTNYPRLITVYAFLAVAFVHILELFG